MIPPLSLNRTCGSTCLCRHKEACSLFRGTYSVAAMAGVVRGVVILLAVFAVLNAEPFEEKSYDDDLPSNANEIVDPEALTGNSETDEKDIVDELEDVPFQMESEGMDMTSEKLLLTVIKKPFVNLY